MKRFALIGCGRIAKKHAEVIKHLQGASLAAVADIVPGKAEHFGKTYGVKWYTDYMKMLESEDIDIVNILTPSGAHISVGMDVVKKKKHIIIEKPLSLNVKDADKIIHLARENNVSLFVVKQNRYNLPVVKLKEALDAGRFGKLVLGAVRVRWCRKQDYYDLDPWRGTKAMDGGVLTNQASHHIDLLQWLLGPVDSVIAKTATMLARIETEDTGVVIVKFRNGALGVIEATTCARPVDLEGSISVLGEKGSVEIGGFAVNEMKTWIFDKFIPGDDDMGKYSQNPPNVYGFGHYRFMEEALECINTGRKFLVDGIEGKKSVELINAIYKSAETGKEVFIGKKGHFMEEEIC
ncbi:MAG: Gfo/Idh/MocA family oxidoreductase [Candidatus Omnitrophica bacterium]|nr:Gfo/Idh/MocA family oxidoreductase [Candidatus Omnitrophota bacterium]